jgi:hypothetical protein
MVPTCWSPIRDGVAAAKERCDGVVRPSLTKTFDDTASSCPFASVGLEDSCSGEARGSSRGALYIECETFMTAFLHLYKNAASAIHEMSVARPGPTG